MVKSNVIKAIMLRGVSQNEYENAVKTQKIILHRIFLSKDWGILFKSENGYYHIIYSQGSEI